LDHLLSGYELRLERSVRTLVVTTEGSYETWTELGPENRFVRASEGAEYWVGRVWEAHGYRYEVVEKIPVHVSHHVELSAKGGEIKAELDSERLEFRSPTSTTLMLTPPDSISSGTYRIETSARDAGGRLVQTATYELALSTRARPSSSSGSSGSSSSSRSSGGSSNYTVAIYVQALWSPYISGASVELKDRSGNLIASGTTDSSGKVEWNLEGKWDSNTRWYAYATHPDWLLYRSGSFHTGTGGPKSATVQLYRGAYRLRARDGQATVQSNGRADYAQKGMFGVERYSSGWKGGTISLNLSEVARSGDKITTVPSSKSLSESHVRTHKISDTEVEVSGADGDSNTIFEVRASVGKSDTMNVGYPSRPRLRYVVDSAPAQ
jgi:hypothetical protein